MKIFLEKTVPSEPISRDKKDNSKPMNGVREFIRSHISCIAQHQSTKGNHPANQCDGVAALSIPPHDLKMT